jgi:transcriptional regulator with XRE-family HTH domain
VKDDESLTPHLTSLQERIGVTVTALRKKMGYTSHEYFANEYGFSRETYRKIEAGKTNSTLRILLRIAIIHGLTFKQFIALVQDDPGETANSPKE